MNLQITTSLIFIGLVVSTGTAEAQQDQMSAKLVQRIREGTDLRSALTETYKLPPGQSDAILREAWLNMDASHKTGILNFASTSFPDRCLGVVRLAVTDRDIKIQTAGFQELEHLSFLPLTYDYSAALRWIDKNKWRTQAVWQADSRRQLLHEFLTAKGADLDVLTGRFTNDPGVRQIPATWPNAGRRSVFYRLISDEFPRRTSGYLRMRYADAATIIGVDDETLRSELAPRWYRTDDSELCMLVDQLLVRSTAGWVHDELVSEYRYSVEHPDDHVRGNSLRWLEIYFQHHQDSRVLALAMRSIAAADEDSEWRHVLGMVEEMTGLEYDPNRNKAWWERWWAENQTRYGPDKVTPPATKEQEAAGEKIVTEIVNAADGERLSRCHADWPLLTTNNKISLVNRLVGISPPNLVALLEIPLLDADATVQNEVMARLSHTSLTPMTEDYESAKKWVAQHRSLNLETIRVETSRKLLARFLDLPAKELASELMPLRDLLKQSWVTGNWSQDERNRLFQHAMDTVQRASDGSPDQDEIVNFASEIKADSETIKSDFLGQLDNVDQKPKYQLALSMIQSVKDPWATDALIKQIRLMVADPTGTRANFLSQVTLHIDERSDKRFIPEFIRAMILGPDDWQMWLDYYGLQHLTTVPYSGLHDRTWWRAWWDKNKENYLAQSHFEMPSVSPQPARSVGGKPIQFPNADETFDQIKAKYLQYVAAGGPYSPSTPDAWTDRMERADPVRSIPVLIAAMSAVGEEQEYTIGYYHLRDLVGVQWSAALTAEWWVKWWSRNYMRFPACSRDLPKITMMAPKQAPPSPIAREIQANMARIRSIYPADGSYADLEPLRKAIGNAHVVQLGEQSHGDGAAFRAKLRIIRFLHEKCGFDVLLWESGQFDCDQMNLELKSSSSPADIARVGVFPIWTESSIVQEVFDYACKTQKSSRPLQMGGFDPQFSGQAITRFPKYVSDFFAKAGEPLSGSDFAQLKKTVKLFQGEKGVIDEGAAKTLFDRLSSALKEKRASFNALCGESATDTMERYLENASIFTEILHPGDAPEDTNRRDIRMSENLIWLLKGPLKNKKVIVWAASFHLMHNAPSIGTIKEPFNYAKTVNMGQGVHEALGSDVYTIAFLAHRGVFGNPFFGDNVLDQASPDSVEEAFHQTGAKYGFLDLRGLGSESLFRRPQIAGPLGYSPMRAIWPNVFDGFFFTDVMFPSTQEAIPNYAK